MRDTLASLVPDRIRESYALKFRATAFTVIVLLAAVGAVTYVQTTDALRQTTEDRLESAATAQAASLGDWVDSLQTEASLLAETDAIANGDTDRVQSFLDEKIGDPALDTSVLAIHYLDASEPVVEASSNTQFVGVNPQDRGVPWAMGGVQVPTDGPVVSDAFVGPKVNQPVVAVLAPIESKPDQLLVLMVNVGARADRLPETSGETVTRVVNDRGTIIMSHRQDEILTQNAGPSDTQSVDAAAVERGLQGESGYEERSGSNGTVAMGYAPVEGANWVVTTRTPKANAFAVQQFVTQNLAVLLLIAVGGFLLLGLTIGRPTATALDDLSDTAAAIADGDVNADVAETDRVDELGEVQAAFRETQAYVATVAEQAEALAAQDFDDPVLDERVPGPLGAAIENTRADLQQSIADIEAAKEDAIESQQRAEQMATRLDEQASQFQTVMEDIAAGDLTRRLDTDVENDSLAAIAESTNQMLAELQRTIGAVRSFATDVEASAEDICTSAEELETASDEVATTTQEIAAGAERQDEYLGDVLGEMNELSATVEEIAASSKEVAEQSTQAAGLGRDGCEQATEAAEEISLTADEVERVAAEVSRLDDEMERIGEIAVLIDDIAEQTNLLALNANIEAARAGSGGSGDGFAVVADEIKDLSEETSTRTDEIEAIIEDVQELTNELATDMREVREKMLAGADEVTETRDIFEDVVDYVEEANGGIQSIDDATDQQATAAEEIVTMVDEVSDISSQTATDTGDLAAAAEEQTASISTVTGQIGELADEAAELRKLTGEFTVETEAAAAPTDD
jgi:methyl-accepting chemotaxis protein